MAMRWATYVTRREKGDNPVHFNNFRERIQGGQSGGWRPVRKGEPDERIRVTRDTR